MAYDIAAVRAQFPALDEGLAHFEGPGGTQTPRAVIEAMSEALARPLSNRGLGTAGERNAEEAVVSSRAAMADLLAADPRGIVFGRSATQLAYDLSRAMAKTWRPGDEIVVTRLEHDSNIRPWTQAATAVGATVRWVDFDVETTELDPARIGEVMNDRTRVVAVTGASNLIGTRPDLAAIAALVHEAGAHLHVDAVHLAAHALIDLTEIGADSLVCSPYKFLGPHLGVLAAGPVFLESLRPDKLLPSTDVVPERFELGTLPYEMLAGTRAAVDVLAGLDPNATGTRRERLQASFAALEEHETALLRRLEDGLRALPGVTLHSRARHRTPTVLVTLAGHSTVDAYRFLAERGVVAPSGSFYALEVSRHLGLGDDGGMRAGIAPYTDQGDVDRLVEGIAEFLRR